MGGAENTAAEWNLDCRPVNGTKEKYAGASFSQIWLEMWWACGMQVVIMAGWTQEDGNIVTSIGDLNDEIARCEKFQGVQKISTAWDKYIGTHFEPEGEPNTDASDSKEESNSKQKQKPDPTIQVMCNDGSIWIDDLTGRMACAHPKVVAPFKKLPQHINPYEDFRGKGCQKDHSDNIFKFHHWIDGNRDLQESFEGLSGPIVVMKIELKPMGQLAVQSS
ncbi:hypothetical protein BS17DRAFT_769322 [Gyrodon lividus]|nr:hypothetical protein BS17DRAFT_769322 [Gyrodon lividus]